MNNGRFEYTKEQRAAKAAWREQANRRERFQHFLNTTAKFLTLGLIVNVAVFAIWLEIMPVDNRGGVFLLGGVIEAVLMFSLLKIAQYNRKDYPK